jgi:hypothetical protein
VSCPAFHRPQLAQLSQLFWPTQRSRISILSSYISPTIIVATTCNPTCLATLTTCLDARLSRECTTATSPMSAASTSQLMLYPLRRAELLLSASVRRPRRHGNTSWGQHQSELLLGDAVGMEHEIWSWKTVKLQRLRPSCFLWGELQIWKYCCKVGGNYLHVRYNIHPPPATCHGPLRRTLDYGRYPRDCMLEEASVGGEGFETRFKSKLAFYENHLPHSKRRQRLIFSYVPYLSAVRYCMLRLSFIFVN